MFKQNIRSTNEQNLNIKIILHYYNNKVRANKHKEKYISVVNYNIKERPIQS